MRLTRLYIDQALEEGATFLLPDTAFRHLVTVLRLREGDHFILFNNQGLEEATASISKIGKKAATATIHSLHRANRESPLELILIQAISAADKMDLTIQKAVELGVKGIVPVYSERSQRRMKPAQIEKKMRHWQGVIVHATEQSGRTRLATLMRPLMLTEYLAQCDPDSTRIILDPTATQSVRELALTTETTGLDILVGPEGGFTREEVALMSCPGSIRLRLGPRILRTETAGITLLACLQARFGDY